MQEENQNPQEEIKKPVTGPWSKEEVEDLMNAVGQNKGDMSAAFTAISRKYGRAEANVAAKYYFEGRKKKKKKAVNKVVKKKAAKKKTRRKLKGPARILPQNVSGNIHRPSPITSMNFSSSSAEILFDHTSAHVELSKGVVKIIFNLQ